MDRKPSRLQSLKRKYIGDRAFYKLVLGVAIPIAVQNAITNFVSLLDNIMVGRVGTEVMSGVSIANQLMFVFNLCVFGAISGAGIYSAQYHGAGNTEGVRHCFRYKLWISAILVGLATAIFLIGGDRLVMLYLNDADAGRVGETLGHSIRYLRIMLIGLPAFGIAQCYSGTLRETGEAELPMRAGIIAVFVNLLFNYLLIFGRFGFPALGAAGAAIATVISRYVEMIVVVAGTHRRPDRFPFVCGIYKTLLVPMDIAKKITYKGMPLMLNEGLWSTAMATLTQCYSTRGLSTVAALNITSTVSNLFNVAFISMGSAAAIIVGQSLGADRHDEARDRAWKTLAFSGAVCCVASLGMLAVSPFVPLIYRTDAEVRSLATSLIIIYAICMPLFSCANTFYFVLRSGGKTWLTFWFDNGYSWFYLVPLCYLLAHKTSMDVRMIYLCVQGSELFKVFLGYYLVKKDVWVHNIVA